MNISFSEIENLDEPIYETIDETIEEINKNPYFNEKISNNKIQKFNSITKNPKINENNNNNIKQKREKKKGISYDDILSCMNTVVVDGKLEFIRNDSQMHINNDEPQYIQQPQQIVKKNVHFGQLPNQPQQIDPNVKNSYIFNKYFKDYKEPQCISDPKPTLSKQQVLRQLLIDKVNRHNDQIRISQIKSTRLLFNANNNKIIRTATMYNPNGSNHLFKFKG